MRIFLSFDFDRTIADYSKAHGNAILAGITETFDRTVNWVDISSGGLTDIQIITSLVHNQGISYHTIFEQMDNCITNITKKFHEYLDVYPVELLDKADVTLQNLYEREDTIVGLSTGNIKNICLKKSEYTGIDKFFQFGSFGDEVFNRYQLLQVTKNRLIVENGYSKEDIAFHIGDSVLDILSARDVGFVPIGVTTGKNSEQELYDAGAKFVFNKLSDLDKAFDTISRSLKHERLNQPLYLWE